MELHTVIFTDQNGIKYKSNPAPLSVCQEVYNNWVEKFKKNNTMTLKCDIVIADL